MDEPVETRRQRGWAIAEVAREDLELFGVEELQERIGALEDEIIRTRAQLDKKRSSRAAADALFGKRD